MVNEFMDDAPAAARCREKVLERPGCGVHYWVDGNAAGPWLVFLHGAGADHRMFNAQWPAIAGRYRVLMWDARLHGKSRPGSGSGGYGEMADDLLALLDAEGVGRAVLVGQSMGGNLAQDFALLHPGRVDRLVVIDSAYNFQELSRLESLLVRAGPAMLGAYPWKALARASAKASVLSPEGRAYLEDCFERMGKRDFIAVFSGLLRCLREGEGPIGKDILLVVGDRDGTGTIKKSAPAWKAREPRCRLEYLENAGHGSNMDAPGPFNALLAEFLEGAGGRPTQGGTNGQAE